MKLEVELFFGEKEEPMSPTHTQAPHDSNIKSNNGNRPSMFQRPTPNVQLFKIQTPTKSNAKKF